MLGAAFAPLQFVAEKTVDSGWLPWAIGAYGGAMLCGLIAVRASQQMNLLEDDTRAISGSGGEREGRVEIETKDS